MKKARIVFLLFIILFFGFIAIRWIPHLLFPDLNLPIESTPDLQSLPTEKSTTNSITILIGGDIMLDRYIRKIGEQYGYNSLFSGVSTLFHSADIGVANLEGPVTENASKTLVNGSTTDSFSFTFATSSVDAIKHAGITLLSLANNHSDNFGRSGVAETHTWLSKAGLSWFGDPANLTTSDRTICKNSICITFVGYSEFHKGYPQTVDLVKKLSDEGHFVVVMAHWGDEYATSAPMRVQGEARGFVDAGAKAVIGSHPHVIESTEWIGGVPIVYSLGNLVFDQFFSPEVMNGEIVELTISKDRGIVKLIKMNTYNISNNSKKGPVVVNSQ
jgi:poly-gamma-glutamate synthesis protein (capsule biosynthesis protein)